MWPRTKAPQPVVKRIRRGERRESERGENFKKNNQEVIMPTNAERLRAIVDRAEPTPQSPGGLNLDLRVSLYADGHAAFGYADDSGNCINCKTDEQFTGRFRDLVREARRRQRARATAA